MSETKVKAPSEWRSDLWGEYSPGINDFMSVIRSSLDSGDVKNAQLAEAGRNSYVSDSSYTGTERTTNIVGNYLASQATSIGTAANNVVEKVTEKIAAPAEQEKKQPETETKVIYSAFDASDYAAVTNSAAASDTLSNVFGYGLVIVLGLVVLDKIIG